MADSSAPRSLRSSSPSPDSHQRPKRLSLSHSSNIQSHEVRARQDYARDNTVKVQKLCNRLSVAGMNHAEVAERIHSNARTLTTWKTGTTVPAWAVDALESLVMKVEKKVGP